MKLQNISPNKLTRIQGLISELNSVNNQISAIQSPAKDIAEGKAFHLNINAILESQSGAVTKVGKNGELVFTFNAPTESTPTFFGIPLSSFGADDSVKPAKIKPHDKVDVEINDVIALRVLAVVLEDKLAIHTTIVERLKKNGIS